MPRPRSGRKAGHRRGPAPPVAPAPPAGPIYKIYPGPESRSIDSIGWSPEDGVASAYLFAESIRRDASKD